MLQVSGGPHRQLDWTANAKALYKKGQSRLFLLRILRSLNVFRTMLQMFYHSVVYSGIFYAVMCWGSRVKMSDARTGSVLGVELQSLAVVSEQMMLRKLLNILNILNKSHPLHATLDSYHSTFSHRLRPPRCSTKHNRKSFLLVAFKLFNSSSFST